MPSFQATVRLLNRGQTFRKMKAWQGWRPKAFILQKATCSHRQQREEQRPCQTLEDDSGSLSSWLQPGLCLKDQKKVSPFLESRKKEKKRRKREGKTHINLNRCDDNLQTSGEPYHCAARRIIHIGKEEGWRLGHHYVKMDSHFLGNGSSQNSLHTMFLSLKMTSEVSEMPGLHIHFDRRQNTAGKSGYQGYEALEEMSPTASNLL
ncbi:uncharacterized protein LOC115063591 [Mus pahari]|uniref:uncharacterized protein LOC115063591 n=1 Tax=Mus pahari TaxID=10093 RepID=UPI0011148664|nr:uncharacterized protein LOC115063591 [Mus pahari]